MPLEVKVSGDDACWKVGENSCEDAHGSGFTEVAEEEC